MTGKQAEVEAQAEFRLSPADAAAPDLLASAAEAARYWRPDATVILHRGTEMVLRAGPRTIQLESTEELADTSMGPGGNETSDGEFRDRLLRLTFTGVQTDFGRVARILDEEVRHLLDAVERGIRPESGKYVIIVKLTESNPYFGLYVRAVPLQQVTGFLCSIEEPISGNPASITISKNSVSVVAYNPSTAVDAARRYLRAPAA
ncbi:MAG: hypothetical protein Q8P22_09185 [Chloroflexota bacterium]|nr:hypothetical protein [Chloroflexota bacterium]